VTTTKPKAAAAARIGAALAARKRRELLTLLRPCFGRVEPWLQAGKYVTALVSDLPKRNGWTIAQQVGDRTPQRTQRLLNRAAWDACAAMGVVRRFAVAGLDEAARRQGCRGGLAVGALDETSQQKQGTATAGVKRQYLGCMGKVANGITTVHLSYAREKTRHALIGARQWIPAEHIDDPVKSLITGLPLDLEFRTKGELAIDLCAEALTGGTRVDFVCGDEVYGSCPKLREFLEDRGQGMCCGSRPASASPWRAESGSPARMRPPACWATPAAGTSAPPGTVPRARAGMPGPCSPPPAHAITC
jgi:SRSO17 transposase